jgi:WD40 repeat protein
VQDACHFAAVFAESIEEHPLLVYMAALPFTPTNTMLYQKFHDVKSDPSVLQSFGPASSTLMRVFIQHGWSDSRIRSVAFSQDGTRVVSGSFDNIIRIWDIDGSEIQTLRGHDGWVNSVDLTPDGTRIVSGSQDMTIRIWDVMSGIEALPVLKGHSGAVLSVAFSADGARIASGSSDTTIRVWSAIAESDALQELRGHQDGVWSLAFFPDGTRIASASSDKTVRVWDVTSGDEILTLHGHEHSVMSVGISPDGTRIISGSYNNNKRIWDAVSGSQVLVKNDPTPWFWSESVDGWILDTATRKKLFKIPSMVKTRFWLLELLTVRYWFFGFRPHSIRERSDEDEVRVDESN